MKDQKSFRPDPLNSPDPAYVLSTSWNQRDDQGIIIRRSLSDSDQFTVEKTLPEVADLTNPVDVKNEFLADGEANQGSKRMNLEEGMMLINTESAMNPHALVQEPDRNGEIASAVTEKEHSDQDGQQSKVVPSEEIKQDRKLPNEVIDKVYKTPKMSAQKTDTPDFNQWLSGLRPLKNEAPIIPVYKATASKSVSRSQAVGGIYGIEASAATETLAQLLTQQGYKAEAISIYEKLSIRFPEKKDIFADLIQKLKN